ncbi:MAG: HlyD family secretion protein [Lautropia sp.]
MPVLFSRTTRSLDLDGPHTARWLWATGLLLLACWSAWFVLGRVTVYEVSPDARIEVQQAAHPIAPTLAGRIATVAVSIGQTVAQGDVLIELDSRAAILRLREEQSRLAGIAPRLASVRREIAIRSRAREQKHQAAVAGIRSARHRLGEAQAGVEFARLNERRLRDESEQGGAARIEALRASAEARKLAAAKEALGSDVLRLESEAETRANQSQAEIEDLNRLAVTLESDTTTMRATIRRLEQEIEHHRLRAPIGGRVGAVAPLRDGGYVAPGQQLAVVVPEGAFVIVAEFPPASVLGRAHPGQRARMRLDGFPWAQFGVVEATVARVGTEIRDGRVRVELSPDRERLQGLAMQHGLPGAIEIAIDEAAPAVLALRAAGQMLSRPAFVAESAAGPARGVDR